MKKMVTVLLRDAVGKSLASSTVLWSLLLLTWQDGTMTCVQLTTDNDGKLCVGEVTDLERSLSVPDLQALGLITPEDAAARRLALEQRWAADMLAREREQYMRLKRKFEPEGG